MSAEAFQKLKSNLELTDTFNQLISQKYNAVKSRIGNTRPNPDVKLIGSLQRKTRIQPRPGDTFDIDILVHMGEFNRWVPHDQGTSAQQALVELNNIVRESSRYSAMQPRTDAPTVSFEYADDVKVELVPAYSDKIGQLQDGTTYTPSGRAYWVPNESGLGWKLADYDFDAQHITDANVASDGFLIPTIKMLKALRREHFKENLSAFGLEVLAASWIPIMVITDKRKGVTPTYDRLIPLFLALASDELSKPIQVPGSHTPPIILSAYDALVVKNKFTELAQNFHVVNQSPFVTNKISKWRGLFGEPFPASI